MENSKLPSNDSFVAIDITTPPKSVDIESANTVTVTIPEPTGFMATLQDQDFQQKSGVTVTVLLELYRVLIASFLILFVPQKCIESDDSTKYHVCSISENAQLGEDHLYNAGFSFNCIT
jgi:hypothetical protein